MQTNDDDMVIDHQVSVCACQMQIEGDEDLDEDFDQSWDQEGFDQDWDQEGLDQGLDYNPEPMDQGWDQEGFDYNQEGFDQGFAQSEIHIEFPEGASIGFTFVNGIRYLVLHSNM